MVFRSLCTVGLISLLGTAATSADDKALAAELKKAEGTWEVASALRNGEAMTKTEREAFRLVVKNGAYEYQVDGKVVEKGKVKFVGMEKEFLFIDLTPADGMNKGKTFKGLFEWLGEDGARVTLPLKPLAGRLIMAGGEKGTGQALYIYKRVKE